MLWRVFFLFSYWSSNTNSGTQKIWLEFLWQWVKFKYCFWASFCLIDELDLFRTGWEQTEDLVVKELDNICLELFPVLHLSCFVMILFGVILGFFSSFSRDQLQNKKGCSMPSYCAAKKSCKKLSIFQDLALPKTGPLKEALPMCATFLLYTE